MAKYIKVCCSIFYGRPGEVPNERKNRFLQYYPAIRKTIGFGSEFIGPKVIGGLKFYYMYFVLDCIMSEYIISLKMFLFL